MFIYFINIVNIQLMIENNSSNFLLQDPSYFRSNLYEFHSHNSAKRTT